MVIVFFVFITFGFLMRWSFILFFAKRYIFTRHKEGFVSFVNFISFIGITIGVTSIIVVMSVMNGFRSELLEKLIGINGHIKISSTEPVNITQHIREEISNIYGVRFLLPEITGQMMIMHDEINHGVEFRGINNNDLTNYDIVINNIKKGDITSGIENKSIIIGNRLANSLGVDVGDTVRAIVPRGNSTIFGFIPLSVDLVIQAIFSVGMHEYDLGIVILDMEYAKKLTGIKNGFTDIDVYLSDDNLTDDVSNKISSILPLYNVSDWQQRNASLMNALEMERVAMFMILSMIVIVAAFNIVSSLTMLVFEKADNIAVMSTIGARKIEIMAIFILCGTFIGFCGTFLGLAFGYLIADNIQPIKIFIERSMNVELFSPVIYFLDQLPSKIILDDVIKIAFMSIILSIFATVYPAIRATKMHPGRLIRFY